MYQDEINNLAKQIIDIGRKNKVVISAAESCTGGMIGAAITSISGSSTVYDRGFITYSNNSKAELLGIDINLINQHGAVSQEIARLMAEGCLIKSNSNLSVSVTGVAGPGGGTKDKPVGLVYIGVKNGKKIIVSKNQFKNQGRTAIQKATVKKTINLILKQI